jgi:hypothetical protein
VGSVIAALAAVAPSCKRAPATPAAPPKTPTLRVFVVTSAAGALEPCGCVKDMLGGVDHAAALVRARREGASSALLVGAGPSLFMDPAVDERQRAQTAWKAEAFAQSLSDMGLTAWVPGANDWAMGEAELARLNKATGAALLAGNLGGKTAGAERFKIVEAGGHKVGIVGVSQPLQSGKAPEGVEVSDPKGALESARQAFDAKGVQIRIALFAMPRGEVMRLIEGVSGFQLVVVGKPVERGETNDGPTPPALVGDSLVVQTPNHLQAVAIVDLFVRGGDLRFKDGSGLATAERRERLKRRVEELDRVIAQGEKPGSGARPDDLAQRRQERDALRRELEQAKLPDVPAEGSFFRYELEEVRESAGVDAAVEARLGAYYKRVNDHNRTAFADRRPAPAGAGKSGYIGADKCGNCHGEAKKFWDGTRHAGAYAPLVRQEKQFNLDCVGCHVTGYDQPGGSTVTFVDGLVNVQCEVCHGPGSRHADAPNDKTLIAKAPPKSLCATECHHPPHVGKDWKVEQAWPRILGPGHGR